LRGFKWFGARLVANSIQQVDTATDQARRIREEAEKRAEEVAGEAFLALKESKHLERVVQALHNKIEGYGDRYVVPSYSILDELAETYSLCALKLDPLQRLNASSFDRHYRDFAIPSAGFL